MSSVRLSELAGRIDARCVAEDDPCIDGVAPLDRAGPSELSFLTNTKYRAQAERSAAAALLVPSGTELPGRALLLHPEPYLALARVLEIFHPAPAPEWGIHPTAVVDDGANLAEDVYVGAGAVIESGVVVEERVRIGPGCVVGKDARIGAASVLAASVVLYPRTVVGKRCLIHSGAVLGADGFGFATVGGVHHKVPQVGRVVLEDDVEVGANTTVDRGALDDTVVGAGSKLDDLVMVAHGVRLGRGALLAAQSGIAGSTRIGEYAMFAGQAGAAGHLDVGPRTIVGAKSALLADLPEGGFVAGIPAVDHRQWKRAQALARKLPEMRKELGELRRRVEELERALAEAKDRS